MRTMLVMLLTCAAVVDAVAQPPRPEPGGAGIPTRADPAALRVTENLCTAAAPLRDDVPQRWNGWGPGVTNTRFQPAEAGGITAADVPRLKLKWAYGLPMEQQPRGQPTVIGGRLFVGSQAGLGYLILQRNFHMDMAGVFAILIVLSLLGVGLHMLVNAVQRRVVFWMESSSDRVMGA